MQVNTCMLMAYNIILPCKNCNEQLMSLIYGERSAALLPIELLRAAIRCQFLDMYVPGKSFIYFTTCRWYNTVKLVIVIS